VVAGAVLAHGSYDNNSDSDVYFDYNIVSGLQKLIGDWKNVTYSTAEAFNAGHPSFTHNTSMMPLLIDPNNWNFSPTNGDLVALRKGANLSQYFATDVAGRPRPATGAWSIGAYEGPYSATNTLVLGSVPPPIPRGFKIIVAGDDGSGTTNSPAATNGLVLYLSFDSTNWVNTGVVPDLSGHGNNGIGFSLTNMPSAASGVGGSYGSYWQGAFGDNPFTPGQGYSQGDYLGVTNLNGFEYLTNATMSVWAWFGTNASYDCRFMDCLWHIDKTWAFGRLYNENVSFEVYYDSLDDWPDIISFPDDRVNGTEATAGWKLYTVTVDCPNNQIVGYTNGVPFQTNTIDQPYLFVPYDPYYPPVHSAYRWLAIGCMNHYGTPQWDLDGLPNAGWFAGQMDEVRIYNRTLSASEIWTNLYLPYKP
jgi:hypothetical protein